MKTIKIVFALTGIVFFTATYLQSQDKPAGKFSGFMFGDYSYNVGRDSTITSLKNTTATGAKDFNAFQFRRIYFTYDNDISVTFTSRFRLEATTGAPFIKDAYLKWKNVFAGSDATFGMQPTPAFEISEAAWGYRSVEKTILDLRGLVSARDLGLSLRGKITDDGMINYWVMVGNNSTVNAETDKYKRYYVHLQIKPIANLQATLYADYNSQPNVNDPASTTTPKATLSHNTLTSALFIGYAEKDAYNVGFEGVVTSTANDYAKAGSMTLNSRSVLGVSVFGSYFVAMDISVFARYDMYNPNTDSDAKDPAKVAAVSVQNYLARNYIIAGLSWKADKNVSILPNILYETYDAATGAVKVDPSFTARVTVHYIFL